MSPGRAWRIAWAHGTYRVALSQGVGRVAELGQGKVDTLVHARDGDEPGAGVVKRVRASAGKGKRERAGKGKRERAVNGKRG